MFQALLAVIILFAEGMGHVFPVPDMGGLVDTILAHIGSTTQAGELHP